MQDIKKEEKEERKKWFCISEYISAHNEISIFLNTMVPLPWYIVATPMEHVRRKKHTMVTTGLLLLTNCMPRSSLTLTTADI